MDNSQIIAQVVIFIILMLVLLCIYYFLNEKHKKYMWLISIIGTVFAILAFNFTSDALLEYKINQSIESLEAHLTTEHSTDQWVVENMGSTGRERTIVLHVLFEDEPQYKYVYLVDGKIPRQVSYQWNQEFVDESLQKPAHLEK